MSQGNPQRYVEALLNDVWSAAEKVSGMVSGMNAISDQPVYEMSVGGTEYRVPAAMLPEPAATAIERVYDAETQSVDVAEAVTVLAEYTSLENVGTDEEPVDIGDIVHDDEYWADREDHK